MKNTTQPQKLAFSMNDAALSLDISRPTLYKLIRNQNLRTYRIGKRRFCTQDALVECQHELEAANAA